MIRQGDVLLVPVEPRILEGCNTVDRVDGRIVLAEGEVTGHAHVVKEELSELYVADSGDVFLQNGAEADLTHEEHDTITLPPGTFKVIQQKEYDPFKDAEQRVMD